MPLPVYQVEVGCLQFQKILMGYKSSNKQAGPKKMINTVDMKPKSKHGGRLMWLYLIANKQNSVHAKDISL